MGITSSRAIRVLIDRVLAGEAEAIFDFLRVLCVPDCGWGKDMRTYAIL